MKIMKETDKCISSQHRTGAPLSFFLLLCCASISVLSQHFPVASATPASTVSAPSLDTIRHLDLSYLHRCGVEDIANTIRGKLNEQQQTITAPVPSSIDNNGSEQSSVFDIDLTASLIGKNISEILLSLKQSEDESQEEDTSSSRVVQLTVRRNQLSTEKATEILKFVLENGPTNLTAAATTSNATAINYKENNETIATGDDNDGSLDVLSNDENESDATAIDAGNTTGSNGSSAVDGNSSATEDVGSKDVDEEQATAISETIATQPTRWRPAFVSIQTLDLGWNNLAASTSSARSLRNLNRALRQLLANSQQCPPTIRLDVCGLGPQSCRDLAKGIVDRYQNDGTDTEPLPKALSLSLACNEGIGDVGVAALAAAIRTVAPKDGLVHRKETKKRRKRKKKSLKQRGLQENEGTKVDTNEEEENTEVEMEADSTQTKQPSSDSSAPQNDAPAAEEEDGATRTILERLDLSGCGIGDAGAEALAIALTNHPLCVKHLDLSNNRITDKGATALARVLGTVNPSNEDHQSLDTPGLLETLDLSHNKNLGDRGAKELAEAFQRDGVSKLILRSCNIQADGAGCFGAALQSLGSRASLSSVGQERMIDLSGNPLGILSKKKKSGNKYSATALRSKATDTTKAYMNIIGKSLQKGLNTINGVTSNGGYEMDTLESDDEEEKRMGENTDNDDSIKKCGALSLAEAFIQEKVENAENESTNNSASLCVKLGLRHCSFDTRASEALAAILQESKQKYPEMKLSMDMAMNDVLEEDTIAALQGEEGYDDQLEDMAEVYLDALEVMREAKKRALNAARMASARAKARAEKESSWGAPPPPRGRRSYDYEETWSEDVTDEEWDASIVDDYERNLEEDYSDDDW